MFFLCRYDLQATFTASWRTDLCVTENLMINVTRCVCPVSGTYSILLTKKNFNVSIITRVYYTLCMCTQKPGNEFIINMLFISYTVHLKLLIVNGCLTLALSVVCAITRSFSSSVVLFLASVNTQI